MSRVDNEVWPRPFYLGVGATRDSQGVITYRRTSISALGIPMQSEGLGTCQATCGHLWCALTDLASVALVHALALADEHDASVQLPLWVADLT